MTNYPRLSKQFAGSCVRRILGLRVDRMPTRPVSSYSFGQTPQGVRLEAPEHTATVLHMLRPDPSSKRNPKETNRTEPQGFPKDSPTDPNSHPRITHLLRRDQRLHLISPGRAAPRLRWSSGKMGTPVAVAQWVGCFIWRILETLTKFTWGYIMHLSGGSQLWTCEANCGKLLAKRSGSTPGG